jgi:hypothetical protein
MGRTCDLFFLRIGQSPILKKNKSHVQKISFAAVGGIIRTQILNEPLNKEVYEIKENEQNANEDAYFCCHTIL